MKRNLCWILVMLALPLVSCKKEGDTQPVQSKTAPAVAEEDLSNSQLKAKSRQVLGDVKHLHKSPEWKTLRVGKLVVENDKIKTALESHVVFELLDGSILTLAESSELQFKLENIPKMKKQLEVDLAEGKVHFDIQKQSDREIIFKTGTATTAIRGTMGFVGNVGGNTVASLKEGKIEVKTESGEVSTIGENQTVLVDSSGKAKTLELTSSGTIVLAEAIDSIVSKTDTISSEHIEKSIQHFDESYKAKKQEFEKRLQFKANDISDTLFVPKVTLLAKATPGIIVNVLGKADTVSINGIYEQTFTWGDSAYGTKRFFASCSDGYVEIPCFMWVTEYAPIQIETPKSDSSLTQNTMEESTVAPDLNLAVKINGARTERKHLDLPSENYNTNLKFNLSGITQNQLNALKSISVLRNGKAFKTFDSNDLTSLNYEVPITIARNKIADFEVVATLKNGKRFRAKKTYEVYCLVSNHPGGKARNSILSAEEEYARIKQSGGITHE